MSGSDFDGLCGQYRLTPLQDGTPVKCLYDMHHEGPHSWANLPVFRIFGGVLGSLPSPNKEIWDLLVANPSGLMQETIVQALNTKFNNHDVRRAIMELHETGYLDVLPDWRIRGRKL